MREDSHYTLGNKLILIIPEGSSCDYIRNRKFIQWQSTVLPISTIKSTVLSISTITSHLKVYTVTVSSSTNINNHLSPQGLYSDSQQFYQYQQSPLTSHLKVYTVTVNSSTNINNHLSPQGLYSDSQQFYQYQQSPLTSRFIQWQSTVLSISTITSHLKVYTVTVNSSININNHLSPQDLYSDSQQFYQYQQSPLTSRFIQWQSTVLPISTITSHLKVYTVTVNSSTNINNHLSPQGLYSDSQQFYQYQQSPLTSRFIQWQSTILPISTITSHLTGHQNTTYYDENPGTLDRQEHKCGVVKSINGNTRTIQNVY